MSISILWIMRLSQRKIFVFPSSPVFFKHILFIILFLHFLLIFTKILSLKQWVLFFSPTQSELWSLCCLVCASLGPWVEQGAEVTGLKVKHHTASGRPSTVCQSLLSSSSCPPRCATACTACALNLTNAAHDCSKAGGLQMCMLQWSARFLPMMRIFNPAVIFAKLYIHSFIWNLHDANPQPITFTLNLCGSVPANYNDKILCFIIQKWGIIKQWCGFYRIAHDTFKQILFWPTKPC